MARRQAELLGSPPCATAEQQPQVPLVVSYPPPLKPVAFVNGFQKRLGVYKGGCRDTGTASDSESDISSLEIDSNVSDSSLLSNPASPKSSLIPQNGKHLHTRRFNTTAESAISEYTIKNSEDMELEHPNTKQGLTLVRELYDNNNSHKRPDFSPESIPRSEDMVVSNLTHKTSPTPQRRSPITASRGKRPDTQPLVLKIRRRTWAHDDEASRGAGDIKRVKSDGKSRCCKSASESLDCHLAVKDEWQSVIQAHLPTKKDETADTDQAKAENFIPPKRKHHHRHKSNKSKLGRHGCTLHRNGIRLKNQEHSHGRKTTRKKCKGSASKNHSKTRDDHSGPGGKTLRLPSDPQKAVRVLEKALESINAQIKQLKRETELDEKRTNKLKSRRGRKKGSRKAKNRLGAGGEPQTGHSQSYLAPTPTVSHFKLSDFFPVIPSLIVHDNDLHPAYRSSVDLSEPPLAGHPIWRWRIGQPPLPRAGPTALQRTLVTDN